MNEGAVWSEYERYVREVITPVHRRLDELLAEWRLSSFWQETQEGAGAIPQPVQDIRIRNKRLESVLDKFHRQPDDFPNGRGDPSNLRKMRDLLGARVVVYVPDQLRLIDQAIRESDHLVLDPEFVPRCYLPRATFDRVGFDPGKFDFRGSKPSGYSSVHYFVRLKRGVVGENPIFEIQIRTMLEQVWGEIEHQLGYKADQGTEFSVSRQFRVISSHLAALDDHFDFLYDRLTYLQSRSEPEDDDLVNAENLPRIMHDHQIVLRQSEVDGLLRIMQTYDLLTVRDLRARLQAHLLEPIRRAHGRQSPGEPIGAFDVLPTLVQLETTATATEVVDAYNRSTENAALMRELRKELRGKVASPPASPVEDVL